MKSQRMHQRHNPIPPIHDDGNVYPEVAQHGRHPDEWQAA
jgi:hypothetical protein